MKKILCCTIAVLGLSLFTPKAFADVQNFIPQKVIVQTTGELSTNNPPQYFRVLLNDNYKPSKDKVLEKGTQLFLEVTKVSKENYGKLDASIQARVVEIYIPSEEKTIKVKNPDAIVKISKYEPIDITNTAVDTGISVANYFVKNVTYPAHFAKGVIQNNTGNRLQSGLKETYDSSVLSYTSKGQALNFKTGDLATMSFFLKAPPTDNDNSKQTQDKKQKTEEK